mgnify:CR=1 FL=1|tara:strand:+ start:1849 stop:2001 length:153 start_codon:yes stop_codon:yes gene_type:complete
MLVDEVYIGDVVRGISAQIEDLIHRMYTLEDSIANCNAAIEEIKEEKEDA